MSSSIAIKTTMLNVKVPVDLKKEAQSIASSFGIPVSSIVNDALRTFVANRSVTFEQPLVPNAKTAKILLQAKKEMKAGKGMSPAFTHMNTMDSYLDNL